MSHTRELIILSSMQRSRHRSRYCCHVREPDAIPLCSDFTHLSRLGELSAFHRRRKSERSDRTRSFV